MQCCEFEMVLAYLEMTCRELGIRRRYRRMELADLLMDHGVTTIDRLADVVSLARNL
ncbi:MAG: hypothetical protein GWN09_04155, partial [Gammaproteobacteria bacterium]|nr:hypothetical protein [Gammaproteobacteria bacterium]